jgi:hypothetical protein
LDLWVSDRSINRNLGDIKMAKVSVKDNQLVISMQGTRKVGTLTSEFSVPLGNVKRVTVNTEVWETTPRPGQKEWGTDLYGLYFGGIFIQENKRVFYDLKRNDKAVVIELEDATEEHHILTPHVKPPVYEDFSEIIIGVDSPGEVVEIIESAIKRQE